MPGVVKGSRHAWGDLEHVSVSRALEPSNYLKDVIGIVERADTGLSPPPLLLINIAAITDLDMS
jgi:hypothetical protein